MKEIQELDICNTVFEEAPQNKKKWPKQFHGMICFHSNCYQSHAFFIVYSGVLPVWRPGNLVQLGVGNCTIHWTIASFLSPTIAVA